ncbi:NRDE family protein [Oleiagrimonas citrea]|uniref:NRDE family protein n=1 Tax=Oleiagrimonas citrea TaxID=1665687 RepID=A0A846ZLY3_9GAMM|nr:NRDE family protein [Oleiagrimonas citrea]NKZ38579.1 NRDE family protein [Oleiagrimonas citrea]
MCLIAFAWQAHPRWRLLLLANRDEFHARPTAPLATWDGRPGMAAGRDLRAGGTWLGACADGRVATVTNVRDPGHGGDGASRGLLVSDYLRSTQPCRAWGEALHARDVTYRPFNLLCFDAEEACYLGNHPQAKQRRVEPGVHGLSNADFDTPWPKTQALMQRLTAWIEQETDAFAPLWAALADSGEWPDAMLPDTGVGIERERMLSAAFIRGRDYGTRASTLVAVGHDGRVWMSERRFGPLGVFEGERALELCSGTG